MSNGGSEESWEQRLDFREESTPESSGWESVWVFGIQQINLLPSTVRSGGLYLSPSIVVTHVLWYLRAHRGSQTQTDQDGAECGAGSLPEPATRGRAPVGNQPRQKHWPLVQHSLPFTRFAAVFWDGPFPCGSLSRPTCCPCTGLTSGVSPRKSSTLGASLWSESQAGLGP